MPHGGYHGNIVGLGQSGTTGGPAGSGVMSQPKTQNTNPYKQAAESMKSAGIKTLAGDTTDDAKGEKARKTQRDYAEKTGAQLPQSTNVKSQKKLIQILKSDDTTENKAKRIENEKLKSNYISLMSDLKKPESEKKNPFMSVLVAGGHAPLPFIPRFGNEGIHQKFGKLADELSMAEGFEGGAGGVRDTLRHTLGSSYVYQGYGDATALRKFHQTQKALYTDVSDMNFWYTSGGPNEQAIKNSLSGLTGISMSKAADAHNNTLGASGIFDGMSFEERYKKTKDMVIEQLEHYVATNGEFKAGLPVWNPNFTSVERAINQLNQIKKSEEDIIESRRKGVLSQPSNQNLSELEQIAVMQRDWRSATSINKINQANLENKAYTIHLNRLKEKGLMDNAGTYQNLIDANNEKIQKELAKVDARGGFAKLTTKFGVSTEEAMNLTAEQKVYLEAQKISNYFLGVN
tara:strand:+ start:105 stop:1484 length:1380 start_codon:yes stop_codon:yes gene_type:complete